jgi:hypothetical protein
MIVTARSSNLKGAGMAPLVRKSAALSSAMRVALGLICFAVPTERAVAFTLLVVRSHRSAASQRCGDILDGAEVFGGSS